MPQKTKNQITLLGVNTHNLKNIDLTLPKNKVIVITWISGSGKSSLAFDTIYKEGQYRYIESLSSYLRQFFNLWTRPEIAHSEGLSPAIAIEQNKRIWNIRSTVWTLTETDDYLRLLFAKLGQIYCWKCWNKIQAQTVEQIISDIFSNFEWQKVYIFSKVLNFKNPSELKKWAKKNKNNVEKDKGFVRYLVQFHSDTQGKEAVEYFYLEEPNLPQDKFPVKVYPIYDKITIKQDRLERLKEDIIKILDQNKKFGVLKLDEEGLKIKYYTDKNFCPNCDISYPEFTPQHFSPNRQEGACPVCHWLWTTLQVDWQKIIDPNAVYSQAVLPWKDSTLWQAILEKLWYKYESELIDDLSQSWFEINQIDPENIKWKDLPDWFKEIVVEGDGELLRVKYAGKYYSLYYKGIEDVLVSQYNKGLLTVDFQAMLDEKPCPECKGAKLKKESLSVYIGGFEEALKKSWRKVKISEDEKQMISEDGRNESQGIWGENHRQFGSEITDDFRIITGNERGVTKDGLWSMLYNIADLQTLPISDLLSFLKAYFAQHKENVLVERIVGPLIDRLQTILDLWLGYLQLSRPIDSLSWGEIQRLRLAKQLGNKLTWIIYVLDEPTIWLDEKEIQNTIRAIKKLQKQGNTIIVVEHNEDFIKSADWVVEVGPGAGDFGGKILFNWPYEEFIKSDTLTAQYIRWEKKVELQQFSQRKKKVKALIEQAYAKNEVLKIKKAHKYNLANIDLEIPLGTFTIITWPSGAWKTTLMYHILYKFLSEKEKWIQSYIRLQLLKQWKSWEEILNFSIVKKEEREHYQNIALQEFFKHLEVESIRGWEKVKNVVYVDQTSIGKTPRSCPATFVGVFDDIRKIFAWVQEAKMYGFGPSHFSFNSSKGACPECQWYWYKKVELQFLPDTYVPCQLCKWKRYKPEILEIKRRGQSIADVLDMYIEDAYEFFQDIGFVEEKLKLLVDMGLGYLKLGQPAHTLSWWESQRIKLVKHLLKKYKGHTIYFLDEPTVWLHPEDIKRFLSVLYRFLERWDTILMIEHDKNLLKFADKVIRLENGRVVENKINV